MRIMAIDPGGKRTGIAVTDPMQIICTPLTTIPTSTIQSFLTKYLKEETVSDIVVGMPRDLKNRETDGTKLAKQLCLSLTKWFPSIVIHELDERFTSKMAKQSLISSGISKKSRRENKGLVDQTSAAILLQDFLTQKDR